MSLIFLLMYAWAGATFAWAFHLFAQIGQAVDEVLSIEQDSTTVKYGVGITLATVVLWPAILPIWLYRHFCSLSANNKRNEK